MTRIRVAGAPLKLGKKIKYLLDAVFGWQAKQAVAEGGSQVSSFWVAVLPSVKGIMNGYMA
jgi:hypothetical protein